MPNRSGPWVVVLSFTASLAACGSDGIGPPRTEPPPSTVPDARYVIEGVPRWVLVGNALTPGEDTISIAVTAPSLLPSSLKMACSRRRVAASSGRSNWPPCRR